jgi:glycogen debranching enzyme
VSLFAIGGFAQQDLPGPPSGGNLALGTDAVSSPRFIAVHGRRALIQGYASDGLEAWAYPFQILSGYRIAFRPQGTTTAINGLEILSRVVYQPDSVTRIYLGPGFIVYEKLFVPLDRAGAILSYSIQSGTPVEIEVHATPVLNLMWPAALGGQSVEWNASLSAFVLSEPANGFTAVIGSPDIVAHDNSGNRAMRGADETGLSFTLRPGSSGAARVFLALNPPHSTDHGLLFHELIRNRETLEAEAAAHVGEVRENVLRVETPDERVNRAIAWAEIALDQAWVCNPDLGCGYVAGYGPSRDARRPQYEWFFAGDGMVAGDAAIIAGDRVHAREELEFILHYQDSKTGMIWHELSQSAGFIDWIGKYPYMYVHVDITFQFLDAVGRYVSTTGDIAFVSRHWQAIEAAYRYCRSTIDPATALPRIPAGKEGGNEQDRMLDDLGLSASWVAASSSFAQLATLTGHTALAAEASRASQSARDAIPTRYWDAGQSFWISGHTQGGQQMLDRRSGPSQALTMHLFNPQQNALLLDQLASSTFQTDWGSRGVGAGSAAFDPESYAKGSVWPVGTAALAVAFWSEHRPVTALALWNSLLPLTSLDSLGHIHEVLAGNFYRPQIESVPEQTWSSAGFIEATIHGLLGLQVDSIANRLVFAPCLPAAWSDVSLAHIQLSGASVSLELHRDADGITLGIDNSGAPFKFEFVPDLPLGAKLRRAVFNHQPVAGTVESFQQQTNARVTLNAPHGKSELRLDLQGGISVIPDAPEPLRGDPSVGIRIVDVHLEGSALKVAADVPVDRASHLRLKTTWEIAGADGATVQPIAAGLVELTFAATHDASTPYRRAQATIELKPWQVHSSSGTVQ